MEKKNLDWANLGFTYRPIDYRWQTRWHDGAWEEGGLTTDPDITLSEAACVFHYSQSCFDFPSGSERGTHAEHLPPS